MIRLETERLLFRDHEPADLEPYCEMESDPAYRWPQKVHPRAELERSFREAWLLPKPMGLLATVHKPDGRYIGRCGLYPLRTEEGIVVPGEAQLVLPRTPLLAAGRQGAHDDGPAAGPIAHPAVPVDLVADPVTPHPQGARPGAQQHAEPRQDVEQATTHPGILT